MSESLRSVGTWLSWTWAGPSWARTRWPGCAGCWDQASGGCVWLGTGEWSTSGQHWVNTRSILGRVTSDTSFKEGYFIGAFSGWPVLLLSKKDTSLGLFPYFLILLSFFGLKYTSLAAKPLNLIFFHYFGTKILYFTEKKYQKSKILSVKFRSKWFVKN